MKKRCATTSYFDLPFQKYRPIKVEAWRAATEFLQPFNIKKIFDLMGGVGILADVLMGTLTCVEKYVFNDLDMRCVNFYRDQNEKRLFPTMGVTFLNANAYEVELKDFFDLVLFDHNNFTLNNRRELFQLEDFLKRNRGQMRFFGYADSFYYSLKFSRTEQVRRTQWAGYRKRVERFFRLRGFRAVFTFIYSNKDCTIWIFERMGGADE